MVPTRAVSAILAMLVALAPIVPATAGVDVVPSPVTTGEARVDAPAPAVPAPAPTAFIDPDSGAELLGTPAPDWRFTRWVRGGPMPIASLRGKVVLVRFWTENCRFCQETLPAIERLRTRDADRGLVVIGAFHPNQPHLKRSDRHILAVADSLGFGGAIACDQDWDTLNRYWLDGHPERDWVSVSFLIGRDGRIRWVHGGGEYHPSDDPRHHRCDVQFRELEIALERALAEPGASSMVR